MDKKTILRGAIKITGILAFIWVSVGFFVIAAVAYGWHPGNDALTESYSSFYHLFIR